MLVELNTISGTDDQIYIGVVGRGGGREFPLAVANFDDFEPGVVAYHLGAVWERPYPPNHHHPDNSRPGEKNDPEVYHIELDKVDHVYIRKQGRGDAADDPYQFSSVEVKLYADQSDTTNRRIFSASNDLWLGNAYGHQAWLLEEV
jgi:hypothetical protein